MCRSLDAHYNRRQIGRRAAEELESAMGIVESCGI